MLCHTSITVFPPASILTTKKLALSEVVSCVAEDHSILATAAQLASFPRAAENSSGSMLETSQLLRFLLCLRLAALCSFVLLSFI